jgi:hypothetical protein
MRGFLVTLACALVLGGGCEVCPPVNQEIVVDVTDPELASVIADCRNRVPPTNEPRCTSGAATGLDCPCLPLCDRVYAIVVPDPRRQPLEICGASFSAADAGAGQARVNIQYRALCQ